MFYDTHKWTIMHEAPDSFSNTNCSNSTQNVKTLRALQKPLSTARNKVGVVGLCRGRGRATTRARLSCPGFPAEGGDKRVSF